MKWRPRETKDVVARSSRRSSQTRLAVTTRTRMNEPGERAEQQRLLDRDVAWRADVAIARPRQTLGHT